MVDKQLYTPISIVLGGSLIGAGLFFGLRERGAAPPVESPVLETGARRAESSAATPPTPTTLQAAPRRAPDPAAARRAVEEALEAQRGVVVARCIPPAARGGAPSRLRLDLTFDSNGRQIARGIIPARNDPRPELGPCATDALPALQLAAQYAPIALKVDWSLP